MPPYRFHDVHAHTLDMVAEAIASLHGFDPGKHFNSAAERCCDPRPRELLGEPRSKHWSKRCHELWLVEEAWCDPCMTTKATAATQGTFVAPLLSNMCWWHEGFSVFPRATRCTISLCSWPRGPMADQQIKRTSCRRKATKVLLEDKMP